MACSRPSPDFLKDFPKDFPTHTSIHLSSCSSPTVTLNPPFCRVSYVPPSPKISPLPHPMTDLRSGRDCWDTVTGLTFSLLHYCLGFGLSGVAQHLLLLSRCTLGYASLPSNPIWERVQSICLVSYSVALYHTL